MATIFDTTLTDDVTHDETAGLQNADLPVGSPAGDLDDDDILLNSIGSLLTTLAGLGAPTTAIGAARNQVLTFADDANPELKFRLFDGADSDGADPLLDSELTTLTTTAGDDPITLVRINDTTIFGYANYGETGERVAFALYLEPIAPTATVPGGANITIVQYEAIHHFNLTSFDEAVDLTGLVYVDAVQDVAFDDFATAAAGQNLWNSVTDTTTGIQLLFTGFELGSDTVNTSSFAIGSNNQSIVIGDGIVVDFVKGQTPARDTDAKTLSTIDFNERVEGPSGGFTLVQTGGNAANEVGAKVFAYDSSELGTDYHDGIIGGATQTIVAIEVWDGTTLVSSWTRADGATTIDGISYAFDATNDDGVILQGLLVNYRVEFSVGVVDGDDTGKLDRFSVQNVSAGGQANDTFDLGDIRLGGQEGDTAEIGSHIRFEDDGPDAVVSNATPDTLVLDETRPVGTETDGDSDPAGLASVSANFADNFATPADYGTDGAGSVSYALQLTGTSVASGLYAVDSTDTTAGDGDPVGSGESIVLNKVGNAIVGSGANNGLTYFTLSVDNDPASATFGYVTFAQERNVWHADTTSDDDTSTLTLAAADWLRLEQTVTDAEGDSDSAAINLGTGVFKIEDDGPDAVVSYATPDTLVLDETRPVGTETDGDSDPAGLASVSANFADNFATPADYGTDGAGSVSYALQLTGTSVASGLYAVDPADTTAGDGDPGGRGESIVLNKVGNAIVGSGANNGLTYFTISVDNDPASATFGYVTFAQERNVWHADTTSDDDTSTLTLAAANLLRLEQTVTDAEGDSDSAAINLGTGVFKIEDDGPSALQPEDGTIENAVGATATGDLDDDLSTFAANFGEDGAGGLRFTGMNDEVLVDGAALEDVDGNALFSNKVAITLSGFGTSVLTASAGATTVFTMTLDSATGQYTMEMFAKIDDGSFDFDNFATAGAGNFTWVGVAGDEDPAKDLLVTGGNAGVDTVNNDADDLAIGNQWIDAAITTPRGALIPAEVIRLDFVNLGIAANTGDRTLASIDDALDPVTHYDVNNVGFTIMQTQAGRPVDVRISAIDETSDISGTDIAADLTTSSAEVDEIVAVTIISNSLTDPDGTTYYREDGDNAWVTWLENDVIVLNMEGATPNLPHLRDRIFVATDDGFNRLEISNAEAVNSKDAFAIGDVEVGAEGQAIDLAFNGEIVDAEGDADSIGLIGVTVTPEAIV